MLLTNPITQTPKKKERKKEKRVCIKRGIFWATSNHYERGYEPIPTCSLEFPFLFFFSFSPPFPRGGRTFSDIMLDPVERVAFRRIVRSLGRKVPVYVRVVYLRFHHESRDRDGERERERERERMGQKGYPRFHFGSLTLSNPLSERFSDPTIHPMCQCA